MKKIRYKYRFRKYAVWLRQVWDFVIMNKKTSLSKDVEMAVKIVMRLVSSGADIRHSALQGYFHIIKDQIYAKVSQQSITIINGVYAYEILLPVEEGYELMFRIRALNERRLLKSENDHKLRVEKSLQTIYEKLNNEQSNSRGREDLSEADN